MTDPGSGIGIALFRGINVGRTRSLPMKDLKRILEGLGFTDIKTYIQSGNVVFDRTAASADVDADTISAAVEQEFGFRPNVMLLDKAQLNNAVAQNPYPTEQGKLLHFFFLAESPQAPDLETLGSVKKDSEQFSLQGRVFFLYTPEGFGNSKLADRVERCLGVPATARNFNTVSAIVNLL